MGTTVIPSSQTLTESYTISDPLISFSFIALTSNAGNCGLYNYVINYLDNISNAPSVITYPY